MGRKLRIGWFTFTCCEDSSIVFVELLNRHYFEWKEKVDFRYCKMLKSKNVLDSLDVAFVEGAISNDHERRRLNEIRARAKNLVAIGSCACTGYPSAQRNDFPPEQKAKIGPFLKKWNLYEKVLRLDEVVKVDDKVEGWSPDSILTCKQYDVVNGPRRGWAVRAAWSNARRPPQGMPAQATNNFDQNVDGLRFGRCLTITPPREGLGPLQVNVEERLAEIGDAVAEPAPISEGALLVREGGAWSVAHHIDDGAPSDPQTLWSSQKINDRTATFTDEVLVKLGPNYPDDLPKKQISSLAFAGLAPSTITVVAAAFVVDQLVAPITIQDAFAVSPFLYNDPTANNKLTLRFWIPSDWFAAHTASPVRITFTLFHRNT